MASNGSSSVEPQQNAVPFEPKWSEPDVAFFNKIGDYTLAVIEPSGIECSVCIRNAHKTKLAKAQVAIVLTGKPIYPEYVAICEHALQKLFVSECLTTTVPQECQNCFISYYQFRQAQFIDRLTKSCYVGRRGKERNSYRAPVDNLDETHPVNWTVPAILTTEESNVPEPLEHSIAEVVKVQEPQVHSEIADVPEPLVHPEVEVAKVPEPLVHLEVANVQEPLVHSEAEAPSAPKGLRLSFWLLFVLSLGVLVSFSGLLRSVLQAGPTLPEFMGVNTTQSEWDYTYQPTLPTSLSAAPGLHPTTTTPTSTPTGTFTQPAPPTPSPEPSMSTYDQIVGTARFTFGTPKKAAALFGGMAFTLLAVRFGPSIVASFTE